MGTVILLRHGESDWNAKGLFTGWVDVGLSDRGANEAAAGGRLLRDAGLRPDVVHTSVLSRAIQTANLALEVAGLAWLPAALRRPAGQGQVTDAAGVRRGAVHALAPLVRRPAAAARRR